MARSRIKNGWFREEADEFPGQALELKVEEVLLDKKSQFQDILVFKSSSYGNVLALDGVIQATERDEFAYQEMLTHLAMMSHENPRNVLVIGGGDGGVLREVTKHESVESVVLVEIDKEVIAASKKYLPHMSMGYSDCRVQLIVDDGFEYLSCLAKDPNGRRFDVIISDSSDPQGPANQLFAKSFFEHLSQALTTDGIVITQGSENIWLNIDLIRSIKDEMSQVFPQVHYATVAMPTYTSGQLGLLICGKRVSYDIRQPRRTWPPDRESTINRYYNHDIHRACFVLPTFARFLESSSPQ